MEKLISASVEKVKALRAKRRKNLGWEPEARDEYTENDEDRTG
jgi:hypothetical protein